MNPSVLSTKQLSRSQRELLLNAGVGLVEKNFISILPLEFEVSELPENLIFTSKNSVEIAFKKIDAGQLKRRKIFCVGEKTAESLKARGCTVIEQAHYGAELAYRIVEQYSEKKFLFFCGKKRRSELPAHLWENNISFSEIHLYDTRPTPSKIDRIFEGVLFFSPSAVDSFVSVNSLSETTVFCIGTTTAAEAEKHTRQIVLATKPTIESVIVQVVKHFS